MEEIFIERYDVSPSLVADVHQFIYKSAGMFICMSVCMSANLQLSFINLFPHTTNWQQMNLIKKTCLHGKSLSMKTQYLNKAENITAKEEIAHHVENDSFENPQQRFWKSVHIAFGNESKLQICKLHKSYYLYTLGTFVCHVGTFTLVKI